MRFLEYVDNVTEENDTVLEFVRECKWTDKYILLDVMDEFSITYFLTIEKRMYVVEPTTIMSVE